MLEENGTEADSLEFKFSCGVDVWVLVLGFVWSVVKCLFLEVGKTQDNFWEEVCYF